MNRLRDGLSDPTAPSAPYLTSQARMFAAGLRRPVGWQPNSFLTDRAEAERAFPWPNSSVASTPPRPSWALPGRRCAKRVRWNPGGPVAALLVLGVHRSAGKAGNLPSSGDLQERARKGRVVTGPSRGQPYREGAAQRRGYPFPVSACRPRSCGWLLAFPPAPEPPAPAFSRAPRESGGVTPPGS